MKKIISSILTLFIVITPCIIISPSFAQKGTFKIIPTGGFNIAFLNGVDAKRFRNFLKEEEEKAARDGDDMKARLTPRLGIHLGGVVEYFLTNKFSLSGGLLYSQKGFNGREERQYKNSGKLRYGNLKVRLNYFDIPIAGRYYFSDQMYANAGLLIAILVTDKYVYEEFYGNPENLDKDKDVEIRSFYAKGILAGFLIGAGYSFSNNLGINIQIQQTGKMGTRYSDRVGYKNLTLQLGLTYSIIINE